MITQILKIFLILYVISIHKLKKKSLNFSKMRHYMLPPFKYQQYIFDNIFPYNMMRLSLLSTASFIELCGLLLDKNSCNVLIKTSLSVLILDLYVLNVLYNGEIKLKNIKVDDIYTVTYNFLSGIRLSIVSAR